MVRLLASLALAALTLSASGAHGEPAYDHPVNAVVGDASWLAAFGERPRADAPEALRLATHLRYVHRLLEARDLDHLAPRQRERRAVALAHLEAYIERGLFPRRTDDAFAGRRPRFIDDRGVHCAVGFLLHATGDSDLARRINEDFEYAHVPDIDVPALARWAERHGFATRELAMIQPGYSPPPTESGTRRALEQAEPRITQHCAKRFPPDKRVAVVVEGQRSGQALVKAKTDSRFARCFAVEASRVETGGGAYRPSPRPYKFEMTFELGGMEAIIAGAFDGLSLGFNTACLPRPGAIPRSVVVAMTRKKTGPTKIVATTTPSNPAVDTCLASWLGRQLPQRPGRWSLDLKKKRALAPVISNRSLRRAFDDVAPNAGARCHSADAPSHASVRIRARRNAKSFAVRVRGKKSAFRDCLTKELETALREAFTARPDANASFFRIDGNASLSARYPIKSVEELDQEMTFE